MLSEFAQWKNLQLQTQWIADRFYSCFFSHLWITCDLYFKLFSFRLRLVKHIFQHETLSTISCTFLSIVQSIHNRCGKIRARKLSQPTFLVAQHETIQRTRRHAPHSTAHDLRRAVQRSVKIFKNYRVPHSAAPGRQRTAQHSVKKTALLRSLFDWSQSISNIVRWILEEKNIDLLFLNDHWSNRFQQSSSSFPILITERQVDSPMEQRKRSRRTSRFPSLLDFVDLLRSDNSFNHLGFSWRHQRRLSSFHWKQQTHFTDWTKSFIFNELGIVEVKGEIPSQSPSPSHPPEYVV